MEDLIRDTGDALILRVPICYTALDEWSVDGTIDITIGGEEYKDWTDGLDKEDLLLTIPDILECAWDNLIDAWAEARDKILKELKDKS